MVDPEAVRHVARLARLGLQADEEKELVADLLAILEQFAVLNAVDTQDVPSDSVQPATAPEVSADEPESFDAAAADLLALTRHERGGFYLVPRILRDPPQHPGAEPPGAPDAPSPEQHPLPTSDPLPSEDGAGKR